MEADLVLDRRPVSVPLLGADVNDDRARQGQRGPEGLEEGTEVVARHDADVRDAEILEQLARLGEADDRGAQPPRQLEQMRAKHGNTEHRAVIRAAALAPRTGQLDLREVLGERADRRADRHLVVVHDDQHLGLALTDVVERLERQSAHQRGVTDHDRDPFHPVTQVASLREALGDRQPGPGVPAIEHVVWRLGATREAADTIERTEGPELVQPTCQQLMRIGLVTGVPHDPVARRLEQSMQGDRQLDDTERGAEVAAGLGDGRHDRPADLDGELLELGLGHAAQVGRSAELREDGHAGGCSDTSVAGRVWRPVCDVGA